MICSHLSHILFILSQVETSTRNLSIAATPGSSQRSLLTQTSTRNLVLGLDGCDHGLIGADGKVRDEYILQRQSVNRPAKLNKIPLLCDLTTASEITEVDGKILYCIMSISCA